MNDLTEARKVEAAMSSVPWTHGFPDGSGVTTGEERGWIVAGGLVVAWEGMQFPSDAEGIVYLRNNVSSWLDEIERLRARVEELEGRLGRAGCFECTLSDPFCDHSDSLGITLTTKGADDE